MEELLITENEARFFLIHATGGEATRATRHKLEMIHEEMKTSQLAIKNFTGVLEKLQHVIQKNQRDFERRKQLEMGYLQQPYNSNYAIMQEEDDQWQHRYNNNSPRGSISGRTMRRMPTVTSVSSNSSSRSSIHHHKPNEMDEYELSRQQPTPSVITTESNRQLELESIIEQQRRILQELEIERQRLRAQQSFTNTPLSYEQQTTIYPPSLNYTDTDNFSHEDFISYADDFQRSFIEYQPPPPSSYSNHSFLPPDARD